MLEIGFKGRIFPGQWRPVLSELSFAKNFQFSGIELAVRDPLTINSEILGSDITNIRQASEKLNIPLSIEFVVKVDSNCLNQNKKTIFDILNDNLGIIKDLNCKIVHFHLIPGENLVEGDLRNIEEKAISQFTKAVKLAKENNFLLAFEHNEPSIDLFSTFAVCKRILNEVPELRFVWDLNHTPESEYQSYYSIIPSIAIIHLSDTPLPKLNHHLPLGQGKIDFQSHLKKLIELEFKGLIILEIGGLPVSGGYGKDTDEALTNSLNILRQII